MNVEKLVKTQRIFFEKNITKNVEFRKKALKDLKDAIDEYQDEIILALKKDFGKGKVETYLTEIFTVKNEIKYMLKNLKKLSKTKKVRTSYMTFPSKGYIKKEPYGIVLVIAPWNYPINLSLIPLVGAISAGNCCILKLSSKVPNTNKVIKKMLSKIYNKEFVKAVEINETETAKIIDSNIDYIFFTGSPNTGKIIMKKAAKNLIPVTLELGGKSPVIIDDDVTLDIAAKKIVWGKYLNAGQTCVAPDYVLINKEKTKRFIELLKKYINSMYYKKDEISDDYTKIINKEAFDRLVSVINKDNVLIGGKYNKEKLLIEPTVVKVEKLDEEIMTQEIFGPILAIVETNSLEDSINFVNSMPKPLALYIFSNDKESIKQIVNNTSSSGVCINDTIMHITEENLPFGGVGNSGMGSYHGKKSFETFTHYKSILNKSNVIDFKFKYPPYKDFIMKFLR